MNIAQMSRTINMEVTMPDTKLSIKNSPYASVADFKQIFDEDMNSLYLLALLLTADREMAEQCFVAGLQDATKDNPVFKEWARSWARRMIILNAVRVMNPRPMDGTGGANSALLNKLSAEQRPFAAILELEAFDRFVYVMSVLERYSDHHCALLLGCAKHNIVTARSRALEQSGNADLRFNARTEKTSHERSDSAIGSLTTPHLVTSA
jgi:hypothetical protein